MAVGCSKRDLEKRAIRLARKAKELEEELAMLARASDLGGAREARARAAVKAAYLREGQLRAMLEEADALIAALTPEHPPVAGALGRILAHEPEEERRARAWRERLRELGRGNRG